MAIANITNNILTDSGVATSSLQPTISLTTTGTSGAATFTSNTLNIPNYGSALSGYLPLTGGTLTGALGGTSATFSGTSGAFIGVTINNTDSTGSSRLRVTSTGSNVTDIISYSASHASRANQAWLGGDSSSTITVLQAGGVEFLRGASTGAATFSSSLTVTGAYNVPSTSYFQGNATYGYRFNNAADTVNLFILADSGAATFSSSVSVNGIATSANYKLGVTSSAFISGPSSKGVFITDQPTYASIVGINSAISSYNSIELRASGVDGQLLIHTSGNVLIGTTTDDTIGKLQVTGNVTISNTAIISRTRTDQGSVSNPYNVWTTMFSVSTGDIAMYQLIAVSSGNGLTYTSTALVVVNGSGVGLYNKVDGGALDLQASGYAIQCKNGSGSTLNINWTYLRIS